MSPAVCIIEISFLTLHEEQEKQSQRWTQASDYADAEVNERFTHCSALHKGNQTVTANHIHLASAADNGIAIGAVHPAIAALCRGGGCGGGACGAAVRSDGNHLFRAKIHTADIIAYTDDREEREVLQYRKVFDIEDITPQETN